MAKYVPDIKTRRWVIISTARVHRPSDIEKEEFQPKADGGCPFCPGHEAKTPPEVYRIGDGDKDGPGWQVRVIPNKFPITDYHEVIIHSPDCTRDIEELPVEQVTRIFIAYKNRFNVQSANGQVLIFCNHGLQAGASLTHPHSQLVVVPHQINLDAVNLEPINNIVTENTFYITYCPDFSQWPYEVWIAPKKEGKMFGEESDDALSDLAGILQLTLIKLKNVYRSNEPFYYNYYIYHGVNWFLRIIPRFVHRAGFELGTGLSVNPVDPTIAAETLKK